MQNLDDIKLNVFFYQLLFLTSNCRDCMHIDIVLLFCSNLKRGEDERGGGGEGPGGQCTKSKYFSSSWSSPGECNFALLDVWVAAMLEAPACSACVVLLGVVGARSTWRGRGSWAIAPAGIGTGSGTGGGSSSSRRTTGACTMRSRVDAAPAALSEPADAHVGSRALAAGLRSASASGSSCGAAAGAGSSFVGVSSGREGGPLNEASGARASIVPCIWNAVRLVLLAAHLKSLQVCTGSPDWGIAGNAAPGIEWENENVNDAGHCVLDEKA